MVHEEQVLQHLQDLQLGLRNDVHASLFCQKDIYMELTGTVRSIAVPLGNYILPASRAVLRENQRLPAVQELLGEALCPQEAAEILVETD